MRLYPIEAGNFKLDGGAMFGVVPKSLWQKTNPADSNNMIDIKVITNLVSSYRLKENYFYQFIIFSYLFLSKGK